MKVVVWLLVTVGLLPCILLLHAGWTYWRSSPRQQSLVGAVGFIHDEHIRVGASVWSFDVYPRLWAFGLLGLGMVAMIVALVVLLHVRKA